MLLRVCPLWFLSFNALRAWLDVCPYATLRTQFSHTCVWEKILTAIKRIGRNAPLFFQEKIRPLPNASPGGRNFLGCLKIPPLGSQLRISPLLVSIWVAALKNEKGAWGLLLVDYIMVVIIFKRDSFTLVIYPKH